MPSHKYRGKALWNTPSHGKGTCPICGRVSVKVLWDSTDREGKEAKVCKHCRNWKTKKA